ncbi:peptidoglycan-binding domain-containing protein [Georgenia wangjunii]|uniref:peptidoglycan-binding domain-containing protein n=1 Tax=Georgenia wangjunii TaxID=3117730 RepID=UPI002F26B37F
MSTYYHPGILDHLLDWGLDVEVVAGWETRGVRNLATGARMPFNPRGALSHWTAGPKTGERPSLRICLNGRPGIPGPLCNVFLGRSSVVLVAAGRANHAGAGSIAGLTSASQLWGTEAEDDGSNGWTDFQRWAYPRINAAFSTYSGFDESMHFSHAEYATPRGRKVDINGYTMGAMRDQIGTLLRSGPKTPAVALKAPVRDVSEVQVALAVLGYYDAGPALEYIDNDPGPAFRAAVIAYQGDRPDALSADGWWGPATDDHFKEHDMTKIVNEFVSGLLNYRGPGGGELSVYGHIVAASNQTSGIRRPGDPAADADGKVSLRQEVADAKTLAAQVAGETAGLRLALEQATSGSGIDLDAVATAAREGARAGAGEGVAEAIESVDADVTLNVRKGA